ncbi:uncharacterized protein LOC144180364 [Haemaphysalis longicornis]
MTSSSLSIERPQRKSRLAPLRPAPVAPQMSVPCPAFLAAEGVFVTLATLVVFGGGILFQKLGYARDTSDPCLTDGCRRALADLNAAAAPEGRAHPCDDFYEHVCGSWNGSRDAVSDAVNKASRAVLEDLMQQDAATGDGGRGSAGRAGGSPQPSAPATGCVFKLRAFYKSCLEESKRSSLPENVRLTTQRFNASWDAMLAIASSNVSTLEFMVKMALRYKISAGLELDMKNGRLTLGPGLDLDVQWYRSLERVATEILAASISTAGLSTADVDTALSLGVDGQASAPIIATSLRSAVRDASFGVSLQDWTRFIKEHSGQGALDPNCGSAVRVEAPGVLATLSRQLTEASRTVRALYLYLHLLGHVGQVQALLSERNEKTRQQAFAEFCLNMTYTTGASAPLQMLLMRRGRHEPHQGSLQIIKALAAVDRALIKRVQASWLHRDLVAWSQARLERELEALGHRSAADKRLEDCRAPSADFLPDMGRDFFPNLYAMLESTIKAPIGTQCFDIRGGLLSPEANSSASCLSPVAGMEPVFYEGAEPFVNYPTLGTLHVFGSQALALTTASSMWRHSEEFNRSLACLERENRLLEPLAYYDRIGVMRAVVAVRAAIEAVEASPEPFRDRFERQMFFRRACLMTCSRTPDQAPHPRELPPRLRCNLAVRHTRLFHAAFICDPRRRLSKVEACQLV